MALPSLRLLPSERDMTPYQHWILEDERARKLDELLDLLSQDERDDVMSEFVATMPAYARPGEVVERQVELGAAALTANPHWTGLRPGSIRTAGDLLLACFRAGRLVLDDEELRARIEDATRSTDLTGEMLLVHGWPDCHHYTIEEAAYARPTRTAHRPR